MMHPELDPRERRRQERSKQDRASDFRRRRYGREEHRNDGSTQRQGSIEVDSSKSYETAHNSGGDRPRHGRYGRHRSASPRREGDDREDGTGKRSNRRRSPINCNTSVRRGSSRELFPFKASPESALNGESKELFPNKKLAANLKKELFPAKAKISHHRRSDAFDAADETADLFAKRLGFPKGKTAPEDAKTAGSSYGRLAPPSATGAMIESQVDEGLSIRGASQQDQGFKIRGITADSTSVGTIKELFPGKSGGNAGKELFAEKLQGRGGRKIKAEDMFEDKAA